VISLAQAEQIALEQQPQVLVARAATSVARAQADQARAPLLPQVSAVAGYTRETANASSVQTALIAAASRSQGHVSWTSYDFWNVGLSATQLIYDFGQTWERLHSANLTVEAQHASEEVARLGVLLSVRKSYFSARATRELVDVARETLDDQNRHLTQVQGMVQVGTQPPIALAQQRASVANALVQVITSENNYETAKAQLNQAAGIVGGTDYDVGDDAMPAIEDEDQPLETLAAKGLATRPEMLLLNRQREAQQATLRAFRGAYGPTISASAGITDSGVELDQLVPNWNAGIGIARTNI
jgi:outer membrane protein